MRLLVTGSKGQLGSQLKEISKFYKNMDFIFATRSEIDITNALSVEKAVRSYNIDCIINCASYTGVDAAENDISKAMKVNSSGAKNLALIAANANAFLVHFSTDYIFDGNNNKPYTETDTPNPQTVYGKSKLEGERDIISNTSRGLIIRTSWLYSMFGNNFVKTIREKGKEKKPLRVVYDQIGSPTNAYDLACTVLNILPQIADQSESIKIYNYSNEGVASWYDIAVAITELKKLSCTVEPILSEDFETRAIRPHFSLLNKNKIKEDFELTIPHWRRSLESCLKRMK